MLCFLKQEGNHIASPIMSTDPPREEEVTVHGNCLFRLMIDEIGKFFAFSSI